MFDTIIIGSGPAGLSAAVYAKRAELNFVVVEKEHLGTGQISESERVDNYLGLYGENGFDLGEKFRSHAKILGTEFLEGELTGIIPEANGYKLIISGEKELLTRTLIYAAGATHRKLNVKGESELSGKGVSYCAICDGAFYKGKTAAVIGGGDTALSYALFLSGIAERVHLIHRRKQFRANKALQNKVKARENISRVMNASVEEILGENRVESLRIMRNGTDDLILVDGVFVAVGTMPETAVLKGIAQLSPEGYVAAGEDCVTSATGIFAAGDVRTKPLRQVITAAADGAAAVFSVEEFLAI